MLSLVLDLPVCLGKYRYENERSNSEEESFQYCLSSKPEFAEGGSEGLNWAWRWNAEGITFAGKKDRIHGFNVP